MPNQPKMITTNCVECGKEYETPAYYLRRGGGKYCSNDCRYAKGRVTISCSWCDKPIVKKKSHLKKAKKYFFCNNECKYNAAVSQIHPYKTGIQRSTNQNYRKAALRLMENKCVRCGYDEHIELLDVDHIDSNRNNNSLENLQILCIMCHGMKTRKPSIF